MHDREETPLKSKVHLHEVISNNQILFSIKIYNWTYTNFTEFYKKSSRISKNFEFFQLMAPLCLNRKNFPISTEMELAVGDHRGPFSGLLDITRHGQVGNMVKLPYPHSSPSLQRQTLGHTRQMTEINKINARTKRIKA